MAELKKIAIVPNGKRYWVLSDKAEDVSVTVGGFKLEENGGKKKPPLQGRIVAVGDAPPQGVFSGPGCKYKFHDLVIFGAYAGNEHTFDGVLYTVLHEDEILGLVIETPFDTRDNTDLTQ